MGQFMAEHTHLRIEWLVLEQERAVPLFAVAVDEDQIVSFFGAFEQACPVGRDDSGIATSSMTKRMFTVFNSG